VARSAGERGCESIQNSGLHALFVLQNVIVPEAQDAKTLPLEIGIAATIVRVFAVLATIDFDDQSLSQTYEIDDVMIDRQVSFELISGKTLRSQDLPQASFRGSRFGAHRFRA
jgi:hypothetical protein